MEKLNFQIDDKSLEKLLKKKAITQNTFDKVTIAKKYIERKYNLKAYKNKQWKNLISKIDSLDFSTTKKNEIKKEIFKLELQKLRKNREKQTINDYESLSIIGRGAFGEVHVCRNKNNGQIVAIKKIKKEILIIKNQILHTINEQLLMSKVRSNWIVELKASFQEDEFLYLIMEFCPGGDLMSLLILKDTLNEEEAKFYIAELILAVESIHKLDCIHRDIKPDNILITKNGHIKLSDFGLAKISDKIFENKISENFDNTVLKHDKNFSCVGTAYYVAPEVLTRKGYGKEIDWWSVGVIFFEMLIGYAPFCSKETNEVCYKVLNWKKFLKIPNNKKISENAKDLIMKMINNPNKRLGKNGADEIKKHKFFEGFDWNNILKMKAPFVPNLKNEYDTSYFEKFEKISDFYPEKNNVKKRKDVEYIGYSFIENDIDKDKDINDEYNTILEIINKYQNEQKELNKNNNNNSKVICGKKNSHSQQKKSTEEYNCKTEKINVKYSDKLEKTKNKSKYSSIIGKNNIFISINDIQNYNCIYMNKVNKDSQVKFTINPDSLLINKKMNVIHLPIRKNKFIPNVNTSNTLNKIILTNNKKITKKNNQDNSFNYRQKTSSKQKKNFNMSLSGKNIKNPTRLIAKPELELYGKKITSCKNSRCQSKNKITSKSKSKSEIKNKQKKNINVNKSNNKICNFQYFYENDVFSLANLFKKSTSQKSWKRKVIPLNNSFNKTCYIQRKNTVNSAKNRIINI